MAKGTLDVRYDKTLTDRRTEGRRAFVAKEYETAKEKYRLALKPSLDVNGAGHICTLWIQFNLADCHTFTGDPSKAEKWHKRILDEAQIQWDESKKHENKLGTTEEFSEIVVQTLARRRERCVELYGSDDLDNALSGFQEAFEIGKKILGDQHRLVKALEGDVQTTKSEVEKKAKQRKRTSKPKPSDVNGRSSGNAVVATQFAALGKGSPGDRPRAGRGAPGMSSPPPSVNHPPRSKSETRPAEEADGKRGPKQNHLLNPDAPHRRNSGASNRTPRKPSAPSDNRPARSPSPAQSNQSTNSAPGGTPGAAFFDVRPGSDNSSDHTEWFKMLALTQGTFEHVRRSLNKKVRVKVAILDTGVKRDSEGKWPSKYFKEAKSFVPNTAWDEDTDGHGTHAAYTLHQVAPAAEIYIARIAVSREDINEAHVAAAIRHAITKWEVNIISMSFGFQKQPIEVMKAIKDADDANILMFAAASNYGKNRDRVWPAKDPLQRVFCINSTNARGVDNDFNPRMLMNQKNFAAFGENLVADGVCSSGTSVATPVAAGYAALLIEYVLYNRSKLHRIEGEYQMKEKPTDYVEFMKSRAGMTIMFEAMIEPGQHEKWIHLAPWRLLSTEYAPTYGPDADELERVRDMRDYHLKKFNEIIWRTLRDG